MFDEMPERKNDAAVMREVELHGNAVASHLP